MSAILLETERAERITSLRLSVTGPYKAGETLVVTPPQGCRVTSCTSSLWQMECRTERPPTPARRFLLTFTDAGEAKPEDDITLTFGER